MTAFPRSRLPGKIDPLALQSNYQLTVLADSPIGYWPLTDTTGTTAVDLSGNGRPGTYSGGYSLAATQLSPLLGNVVDLDGTDDYIDIADNTAWSPTGGSALFTVEAWIKPSAVNRTAAFIVSKHQEWQLRIESDGKILWDVNQSGISPVMSCTSPNPLTAGSRYHVVATFSRVLPKVELLINGTSVASSTSYSNNVVDTTNSLRIGGRSDNAGNEFIGSMGHIALYNTILSGPRILDHYNVGIS